MKRISVLIAMFLVVILSFHDANAIQNRVQETNSVAKASQNLLFRQLVPGDALEKRITLSNPHVFAATMRIIAANSDGILDSTPLPILSPRQVVSFELVEFFFPETLEKAEYIQVISDVPILGFQIFPYGDSYYSALAETGLISSEAILGQSALPQPATRRQNSAEPIAKAGSLVVPYISSISGPAWNYTCPSTFNKYLQVPYSGRSDSGVPPLVLSGTNLDRVTSVGIAAATGYFASIKSRSATQLTLDVRAAVGEFPRPTANLTVNLVHAAGVVIYQIRPGVIPALYRDTLAWGQCTWWAGGIARILNKRSVVNAYNMGVSLNGNPTSTGFPRNGSVLMTYGRHMSYLESISETKRVKNTDGSTTIAYALRGTQYNWPCGAGKTSFSTTMTVLLSKYGTYTVTKAPVVGYTIDRLVQ